MKKKFMIEAIKLAEWGVKNNYGGPFGAIIVKNNKIIGEGYNQVTSTKDPTAHAEIVAIRTSCKKLDTFTLKGCEIYTSCEPCPMCLTALYWAHIENIYFAATLQDAAELGFDDQFIFQELYKNPSQRKISSVQIPLEEALQPFQLWKTKVDKIYY